MTSTIPAAVLVLCLTYGCCSGLPEPPVDISPHNVNGTQLECNATASNATICYERSETERTFWKQVLFLVTDHRDVIYRALIVFGSVSAIVIIYISFRCIRRRRRLNKSRKYGLITTPGDKLELKPLEEDDDDDEDMTVFERSKPSESSGLRLQKSQRNGFTGKHGL